MISGQPPPPQRRAASRTKRRKSDISFGIPQHWIEWAASAPRALLADILMLAGIIVAVGLAFSIDWRIGVGALASAFIIISILITTSGGIDDGNA